MLTSLINASSTGLLLVAAVAASPARRRYVSCVAVLIAGLGGVPAAFAQGAFQGLGDLPGGRGSHANAVSADGSVVVGFGYDSSAAQHAIRWTQADGMQIMFPGGFGFDFTSNAFGISADGLTIGGWHAATIIEIQAFIWSAATGEQQLATRSAVLALSATGAVGAGYVVHGRGQAPRATIWDIDRHEIFIDSPGVIPNSDARGISADGTVVVGQAVFDNRIRAFRWTTATGMQNIGSPDFGGPESHADAITPDGSVIVGAWGASSQLLAARWTAADGWQVLGGFPGGVIGTAYAVSADGNTIVGAGNGHAFIWRQGRGLEDLQTVLSSPTGWTLTEARGISADGTIIVGTGSLVGVGTQAWIATLPCFTVSGDLNAAACSGGMVTLGVIAIGTGPFAYEWRFNATPIDTIKNPSAVTATLVLSNLTTADGGSYDCVVTNDCDSVTSDAVTLTVTTIPGDIDGDCHVGQPDFSAFIGCLQGPAIPYSNGCAPFDLDLDGDVDIADFAEFQTSYMGT